MSDPLSDPTRDPTLVRDQYSSECGLTTRASIWQPTAEGITPHDVVLSKLRERRPRELLEVGCGTGALAERIATQLPTQVTCIDQSERMVELTTNRGIRAVVADAGCLPFDDDTYDAVLAAWMLYHVADLDQTLSEIRRVLRPGGLFVAVTNGDEHIADLLAAAGEQKIPSQFSRENGEAALRRHSIRWTPIICTRARLPTMGKQAATWPAVSVMRRRIYRRTTGCGNSLVP